ncbi:MAG: ribosome maturation factor RimP [Candidatus Omnitrophica bacterium]|nr:ribosome maturation factor RimP [Candidatus Omnitrophota bacterium]
MDRQEIIEELRVIIGDYLKNQGLDLVDLIYRQEGRDFVVRILVDKPEGGITIGECAGLNIQISNLLDEKDILQTRYILEVASPGLDRPLKVKSDFTRCINRKARFFFNEPINGKLEIEGLINKVEGESIYIENENGIIEAPLTKINKAKQVIE